MSAEGEPAGLPEIGGEGPLVDHFAGVKRAASIVGDLRKALREEGFTREETFDLVQTYWSSEMGVYG
ncbi:hypothetical protein OH733_05570 [Streptomyces griseus]|uniref:DUF7187 family protein n=1 Tax=Streptomyces griseus TaxID=1911 RepID=UPI00386F1CC8|nr:hypothetical protein OH733_05570 [Streptomyces griseus]WTD71141.1 hypothetical protein OH763_31415 [Streptomyces griseus]